MAGKSPVPPLKGKPLEAGQTVNPPTEEIAGALDFPYLEAFVTLPGRDAPAGSLSLDELSAWENEGVTSLSRASDLAEALSDEKQDPQTSINFPLHWTSVRESWDYLYEFSIACELLGPRPDDLILDLAAGTCWASEFLNRLGVRTVAIDLSIEMMKRGRERLASDSRLTFRTHAHFVTARGQALPFPSDVFDGVMCMNALHHHPSYVEVLKEIHRILKPGGKAVFSEPGTTHSQQPLSLYRMREEHILEKPVSLPAIRRLAMEVGFTQMKIVPLRSASGYVCDYGGCATQDAVALNLMWEDTLKHSPSEHARFLLSKGGDIEADTFLPASKLVGRLRATFVPEQLTETVVTGSSFIDRLRVFNDGTVVWRSRGRRFGGQVTCGLKVFTADGTLVREDLGRTPLPFDISPGGSVCLLISVLADLPVGRYELRYDMVVEGVTWFEFQGSTCLTRSLRVLA